MTLLSITNEPVSYAWGSSELLSDLLGITHVDKPIAELWFGTHEHSPAKIASNHRPLSEISGELGYLVKFLAAARPLSIQVHPSLQRAREQFALGNPSYSDGNHKPELIVAISEFRALCGFREPTEVLSELRLAAASADLVAVLCAEIERGYLGAMEFIFSSGDQLIQQLLGNLPALPKERASLLAELSKLYPGDSGIAVSLLMNLIQLRPNQALYVPAGMIHAYISGLGVEIMASSDNVLRCGLTPKAIDVPELIANLDYRPLDPRVQPNQLAAGITEYPTSASEFRVYRLEPSSERILADIKLESTAIVVCTAGEVTIGSSLEESLTLRRGQACYLADANYFSVSGSGTAYLTVG